MNNIEQITENNKINCYPNPFSEQTLIKYYLDEPSFVKLIIFNLMGNEIETIVNKFEDAGEHAVIFSARELPSGTYFYRIITKNKHSTGKLLLM